MLTPFDELLNGRRPGTAVGAFTCYDLATAIGVTAAAADADAPVILLVGERSALQPGGEALVRALVETAHRSPAPACVQLDHTDDLALARKVAALGVGAVMIDHSALPRQENIAATAAAVTACAGAGAFVECELGGIAGDEDVSAAIEAGALTEPSDAAELIATSGAACLAVSIGNVHGSYREPPQLDWERLRAVRAAVPVHLSLHGASGIPDAMIRRAIADGIAKVNVNTELRRAHLAASRAALPEAERGANLLAVIEAQTAAVQATARAKLTLYGEAS